MNYEKLSKKEGEFLAMTGYTIEEFLALLEYFEVIFYEYMSEYTLEGFRREKRKYVNYKKCPLPTSKDKLLFILVYLKQNPTQICHAKLFNMTQPKANLWIHSLHKVLNLTLAHIEELPAREELEIEAFSEEEEVFWHDGTERAINRPKKEQKSYYSGKKKCHTIKNVILINTFCQIIFLSATFNGNKHDKSIAEEYDYKLPVGSILYQDKGFQGFGINHVIIVQPKKKPRGKELTEDERQKNAEISSVRIRIEHVIGGVKRYRIIKEKMRNWRKGFRDLVMETCCGLHNFRLHFRPWNYASS